MTNKSKIIKILSLKIMLGCFLLLSGQFTECFSQTRDPFMKPGYAQPRSTNTGTGSGKPKASAPVAVSAPSIESRIEYYKRQREEAAGNGLPLPKVTSVLTLDEMAVTGIFRTTRGYAAMVEATPIKLSYTIYPGEKFFDGQLVAVEENQLVFRKVRKISNGKFVSSVENKMLRKYSTREEVQGTAPAPAGAERPAQSANNYSGVQSELAEKKSAPADIVSPLDEMNKQPAGSDAASDNSKKSPKKTAKAKNKKQ